MRRASSSPQAAATTARACPRAWSPRSATRSITEAQLNTTIEQSRAEASSSGQTLPKEGEEGYDDIRRQALQSLVQQKVVEFEAKDCGEPCEVTEKDITAELARIRTTNFQGSQKKFDAFLKERKISKADANAIVKSQLQQQALFDHVTRGVRFTDADAQKYYDENAAQFKVPAGRTASHILVPTKAEADRIRAEVTPENFAAARQGELDRHRLGRPGRQPRADHEGPARPRVREGRLRPQGRRDLAAGEDPVRLAHHHGEPDPGADDDVRRGQGADHLEPARSRSARPSSPTWSEKVLKEWAGRTVYATDDLKPATTTATTSTAPTAPTTAP